MLFPHVVQTEADKVFVNILNTQAVALADGDIVVWDTSTADGVRSTQPATGTLSLVIGAADGAIAASAYGLAQSYGYKAKVNITGDASHPIVVGDILLPVNAVDYLTWSTASDGKSGFFFAAETIASLGDATTYKAFIRCM